VTATDAGVELPAVPVNLKPLHHANAPLVVVGSGRVGRIDVTAAGASGTLTVDSTS
jgi:hypothetical protein